MASRLNPYISFDGNAKQAMEFYEQVFGGTLTLNTYGDIDHSGQAPNPDAIMHGMLETKSGYTIMAADNAPGQPFNPGDNITVCLSGDDADELHGYWDKLADGGTVSVPLEKQMWGDEFGMCVDRFGVGWMVNISVS
ncbi:VOC family protein [Actinophytocola sp. NPDC049390]|uniref:VOC family protein n=1 Tax=Actinophytocola sp. NPDC049390 TaxID=3363894 RepID=UPI0037933F8E